MYDAANHMVIDLSLFYTSRRQGARWQPRHAFGCPSPPKAGEGREFGRPVCPGFKVPEGEVYSSTRGLRQRRSRGEMGGRIRAKRMTLIHPQHT
jgi:hypothetical protein